MSSCVVERQVNVGQRVKLLNKDVKGVVAYVGHPTFATGKWIGIILDEPKGKNNGTIRGHAYFTCDENYGTFVRQTQIQLLDDDDNPMDVEESRIPKSRLTGSRTSLAGSRQSLATSFTSPSVAERSGTPDHMAKRAAFVEMGFVETLNPQFTVGQSITTPSAQTCSIGDKPDNTQEVTQLKAELEDMKEKLETLKVKRAEDRDKLKELERLRMQIEQANEFKTRIMAAQQQLQRDLQRAKQECREARETLEARAEETLELNEAVEMAVLDKEMAEERADALQQELELARDKLEEATLDLQLMKAEMEAGGGSVAGPGGVGGVLPSSGGYEMRQLEQQNARLKETLVRLRDLSAHDKHQMQKMQKDLEQCRSEIAELSRTKEKLSTRVEELENQISDLHEQVDAALGAEEMVEQLAEKKLQLEDEVEKLKLEVAELEALQEVHEQLVDSNRELELDLREEIDATKSTLSQMNREKDAMLETLLDREATINKFRELVTKLTEQNNQLRLQVTGDKQGAEPVSMESATVVNTVTGIESSTRSVDLQLRALQLEQAVQRADLLLSALPDHFTRPAGDYDALLFILLLKRLHAKAEMINTYIRDKFPAVTNWEPESLVKSHTAVQYSFRCQLQYHVYMVQWMSELWLYELERCSPAELAAAGAALPDAAPHERSLDGILTLLRGDNLDENSSYDGVERCWSYMRAVRGGRDSAWWPSGVWALECLAHALHSDATVIYTLLNEKERTLECGVEVEQCIKLSERMRGLLKQTRRRLPAGVGVALCTSPWSVLGAGLQVVVKTVSLGSRAAVAAGATLHDAGHPPTLSHQQGLTLWRKAADKMDELSNDRSLLDCIKETCNILESVAKYTQEKEYDIMACADKHKATAPIVVLLQQVKKQLEETKTLTARLENKEAEIKELRKAIKAKAEEVSEMQIRRDLGERKLTSAAKDAQTRAEEAQAKLDEALKQLRDKEKEFEETMDHLQQDIDSLENERGALRDKLKVYSKRVSHHGVEETAAPVKVTGVSDASQHQLKVLAWSAARERAERALVESRAARATLRSLRPLHAASPHLRQTKQELMKKLQQLQYDWAMFNAKCGLINFPKELSDYAHCMKRHKENRRQQLKELERRLLELQAAVSAAVVSARPWRSVHTTLADFTTHDIKKAYESIVSARVDSVLICPAPVDTQETISLTLDEFSRLRSMVDELSCDDVVLQSVGAA